MANSFSALLRAFHGAGVDFILVGGLSAVLRGVPVHSFDVDIVHSREAANLDRLRAVLESLDAVFRIQPERRIKPDRSHLAGGGHLNLITNQGTLDLLGTIGRDLDYHALLRHSSELEIASGVRIRVLDLETQIAIKEQLGSEKDRAMLPLLRQTLKESQRKSDSDS